MVLEQEEILSSYGERDWEIRKEKKKRPVCFQVCGCHLIAATAVFFFSLAEK